MTENQIVLERDQYEYLLAEGRRRGLTVAELVRDIVALHMIEPVVADDPLERIIGIGSDPDADVAREHDRILYGDPQP